MYIVIVDQLGSMAGLCYIQNRALTKRVIKNTWTSFVYIEELFYILACHIAVGKLC